MPLLGNGLLPLPTNVSASQYGDITLVTVIHKDIPIPQAEVYKVTRNGTVTSIGKSEGLGKDDSASAVAFYDGTVRLFVSEADPGGSGTTSKVKYYDFPNAVPNNYDTIFVYNLIRSIQQKLYEAGSV